MNLKNDLDARIAEAWKAHYAGRQEEAVQQFAQIAADIPDNIDAKWGLGLAYRKSGQRDNALQVFQQVDQLLTAALETDSADDRERFFMLKRMVKQQIEQMSEFI